MSALPGTVPGTLPRAPRNGWPPFKPYVRHAPRPGWMHAAIAAAEAEHGPPRPTCACGHLLQFRRNAYAYCPGCGRRSYGGTCDDGGEQ